MKFMITAQVQIEFECTKEIMIKDLEEASDTAVYLAMNPNFHTVEEGVHITNVTVTRNQKTYNFNQQ